MKYKMLGGALLVSMVLSGCLSEGNADNTAALSFSVIAEGQGSGITSQRLEVILDYSLFSNIWLAHTSGISPAPIQPVVDFNKDMVITAFLGTQNTGGYHIQIVGAEERTDSIVVNVRGTLPGSSCIVTPAFSNPYQFIALPRSSKPVAFITTIERVNCP